MNESLLFEAIRSAVADVPMPTEAISPEALEEIYKVSKNHDLSHVVGYALDKSKLLGDGQISEKFKKQIYLAIYRYQQLQYELGRICDTLEQAEIDHIPLKGAVIRSLYPQPWMRTSCDIDLLIKEADLERAIASLTESLNYRAETEKNYHDISLFSESGVHLELHFSIKEKLENIDPILEKVWEHADLSSDAKHQYSLSPEFFLFHHVAHMSYHFINGGCGIKPFIDLALLKSKTVCNEETLYGFLKDSGLDRFYESVLELSDIWFGEKKHSETSRMIEEYILKGGVYGTVENSISVKQQMKGGKFKYLMSKIFIPYQSLKAQYPVLKKHPYLAPFMHVRRWIRVIFKKSTAKELEVVGNIDRKEEDKTKQLLQNIGLI